MLVFAAPAEARSRGPLDPSFGRDGRALVKLVPGPTVEGSERAAAVGLSGGRTATLFREHLYIVGSNGRTHSVTAVPEVAGVEQVSDSLAVGPGGEIFVAGYAGQFKSTASLPYPSQGLIVRYRSNGQLDQSFGEGGVLTTNFGLAPPTVTSHTYPAGSIGSPLGPAMVRISGIAIDRSGRIVITGERTVDRVECRHSPGLIKEAFVARLEPDGSLDPSFGTNGVVGFTQGTAPFNTIGPPVLGPGGSVYVNPGVPSSQCTEYLELPAHVIRLSRGGKRDPKFSGGDAALPHELAAVTWAADPTGGLIVRSNEHRSLFRLQSDGLLDSHFGEDGFAKLPRLEPSRDFFEGVQVDTAGCIWAFGANDVHGHLRFLVARLDRQGKVDRRFGHGGVAITAVPAEKSIYPAAGVLDSSGRLTTVGSAGPLFHPDRIALARYLPPGRCSAS